MMRRWENSPQLLLFAFAWVVAGHWFYLSSLLTTQSAKIHFSPQNGPLITVAAAQEKSFKVQLYRAPKQFALAPKRSKPRVSASPQRPENQQETNQARAQEEEGQNSLLAQYLAQVRARVNQARYYPSLAVRLKQQGLVKLKLVIDAEGNIREQSIVTPARYPYLNQAAIATIKRIGSFDQFPQNLKQEIVEVIVPIVYELI